MKKNIVFLLFLVLSSCNILKSSKELNSRQKLKVLKTELKLTGLEYKTLKNDDSIINEAYKTLKDTVDITKINRRLDSFFAKKYSRKVTYTTLILERVHKGLPFEFEFTGKSDKNDTTTYNPGTERFLKDFLKDFDKAIKRSGGETLTDTSIINSRRRVEPDSIRLVKIKKLFKRKDSIRIEKLKSEKSKKYDDGVEKYNKTRDSL
ncbi:hypothetical protein [Pontimicrobium sp. MEBiC06410]